MDPLKGKRELDAILKYSQEYIIKKKKTKSERLLIDVEPRYVIYARKSTEDNNRQVRSITDQIDDCVKFAKQNSLKVVDIRNEERSAKTAGRREVFNEILQHIREGGKTYNSILAWHPDRLARNMKESGEILDLIDRDVIADLKFTSFSFTNDAGGKMTLSILFAMAKEFSDKLSVDTKRGIKTKVKEGKYCGSYKRGYKTNKDEFFIPDKNSYDIYKEVWKMALKGKPLAHIEQAFPDESIPVSNYLKDPFAAGIYCYGNQIVNINDVDPNFTPLVTVEEFLAVQRMSRQNGGWHKTDDFLPFRDLVKCASCGSYMVPGRSMNRYKQRYLYIACGNNLCREKRKKNSLKANSIRAFTIVDYVLDYLSNHLDVEEALYNDVIARIKKFQSSSIQDLKDRLKILKSNRSKLLRKEETYETDIMNYEGNSGNKESISLRIGEIIMQQNELEKEIKALEKKIAEFESKLALQLPSYESFVNFYKNIGTVIKETQDHDLLDQLVKLVFLNFTVGDKKVLSYELNEPFNTYLKLKSHLGVELLHLREHFSTFSISALNRIKDACEIYQSIIMKTSNKAGESSIAYKL